MENFRELLQLLESMLGSWEVDLGKILGIILLFFLVLILIWVINKLSRFIKRRIYVYRNRFLRPIQFRQTILIKRSSILEFINFSLKILQLLFALFSVFFLLDFIFKIFPWAEAKTAVEILKGIFLLILTTSVARGIYSAIINFFTILENNVPSWIQSIPKSFRFMNLEFFQSDRLEYISLFLLKISRLFSFVLLALAYVSIVLGLFSWTKGWSDLLFTSIFSPVRAVFKSILDYMPNLFFLLVLGIIVYYVSSFLKFFFNEIERGKFKLAGFNREWADTTYKILRFLLIIFTTVVAFPYLPGANSDAFKGISIFLGVLLSLGSTSIVANIVAGIVLTYMLPFRVGDRVKIGETTGDIMEKNLLVTRIRTVRNELVSIPNASILNNQIINYSSTLIKEPIMLHTKITLGYEIPWKKVHKTLITAALKSESILKNPAPFVLQTSLDDYYVEYELNAYTDKPHNQAMIYSSIHQNMLDECAKANIEILSPSYTAIRSGRESTIPPNKGRNL